MRRNLIEAFGGSPKVFGALRLMDVEAKGQRDYNFSSVHINDPSELDEVFSKKYLNPSTISFLPSVSDLVKKAEKGEYTSECEGDFLSDPKQRGRMVGMFEAIGSCFDLVKEYEEKNEMKFDWVVRMRPDSVWTQSIQPYCFWNIKGHNSGPLGNNPGGRGGRGQRGDVDLFHFYTSNKRHLWPDLFYFSKRDISDWVMKPLEFFSNCRNLDLGNAERFLIAAFADSRSGRKITIQPHPFPMTILRDSHSCLKYGYSMNRFDLNIIPHMDMGTKTTVPKVLCYRKDRKQMKMEERRDKRMMEGWK